MRYVFHQNNQQLGIEIFKSDKDESTEIMNRPSDEDPYQLKQKSYFYIPPVNTIFNDRVSTRFLGPKNLDLIRDTKINHLEAKGLKNSSSNINILCNLNTPYLREFSKLAL